MEQKKFDGSSASPHPPRLNAEFAGAAAPVLIPSVSWYIQEAFFIRLMVTVHPASAGGGEI